MSSVSGQSVLVESNRQAWLVRWLVVSTLISIVLDSVLPSSVLAGDPEIYVKRADAILGGQVPYLEAEFEHLPVLLPVVLTGKALSTVMPGGNPALAFSALMVGIIGYSTVIVHRVSQAVKVRSGVYRWMAVTTPLLPIVLFRLDPVPVLFCILGISATVEGNKRGQFGWTVLGALAKGWPLVLIALFWWRRHRSQAIGLLGVCFGLLALLHSTPGFRAGRTFEGVHTETLVGSVILLQRNILHIDRGLIETAGSIYIAVPWWAEPTHLAIGAVLVATVLLAGVRWQFEYRRALSLCGSLVAAVIVASPLLSAQFVFWLAPFVALGGGRRTRLLYIAVGCLSTILIAHWQPDQVWWSVVAVTRVAGLIGVAVLLLFEDTRALTSDSDLKRQLLQLVVK